MINKLIIILI